MSGPLLIIDSVATTPYTGDTIGRRALGGTEATVARVAAALRCRRAVVVAQRARSEVELDSHGVLYAPYDHRRTSPLIDASAVVTVRAHKLLPRLRRRHPNAAMFLWMHCFPGRRLRHLAACAQRADCTVVGVSDYHCEAMRRFFAEFDPLAAARCRFVTAYNPIADELAPDHTPHDPDKLLFLSSPHKGLDQVLEVFRYCRRAIPSLRLYVANPGYLERRMDGAADGVIALGKLPHASVIRHLRDSLCLFYPQATFRETFGLVFAEANAVGTPVLAHPLAAAPEVLGAHPEQLVDVRDPARVLDTLRRWRRARPRPRVNPAFKLSAVTAAWERLLDGDSAARAPLHMTAVP